MAARAISVGLVSLLAAVMVGGAAAHGAPSPSPAVKNKDSQLRLGAFRFLDVVPPPQGWQSPAFDDSRWSGPASGPFAPGAAAAATPAGAVPAGTAFDYRPGGSLLLRTRFDVDEPARLRLLELRVLYADGFVAYLNGREVARRGLAPGAAARPAFPHGPEVEKIYLPIGAATTGPLLAKGNLLAVEIRAAAAGGPLAVAPLFAPAAPAGDVTLGASSGIRIVRGPYLIAPAESQAGESLKVAWETDLPGSGVVTVEPADARDGAEARQVRSGRPATRQVIALTGLTPGRRYRYRLDVQTAGAPGGDKAERGPFVFQALPDRTQPLRFAVYGDMRAPGHDAHRHVVAGLVREAPALVLNTGDLVSEGSEESNWQRYFEITAPLGATAPVVPALGNHDVSRGGLGAPKTWKLFGLASPVPAAGRPGWTSLDLAGVHFIILDSSQIPGAPQRQWLIDDLARARRTHPRAILAFCHEGPWAHGPHGGAAAFERDLAPLLAAAGVDVLFAGHDHIYERGVGATPRGRLPYVITGGGGAPLYNPTCAPPGPPIAGVPGPLAPCPRSVAILVRNYHYVMVEVGDQGISLCPRFPDGTPVEPCVVYPRRR